MPSKESTHDFYFGFLRSFKDFPRKFRNILAPFALSGCTGSVVDNSSVIRGTGNAAAAMTWAEVQRRAPGFSLLSWNGVSGSTRPQMGDKDILVYASHTGSSCDALLDLAASPCGGWTIRLIFPLTFNLPVTT